MKVDQREYVRAREEGRKCLLFVDVSKARQETKVT